MVPVIQVVVDGRLMQSANPPQLAGGTVVVPLDDVRALAQRAWYRPADRSVTIQQGDRQIVLFVGRFEAWINGRPGSVRRPPAFTGQTLYVPLAVCARALGARVVYEPRTHTVVVATRAQPLTRWTPPPPPFVVPTPFPRSTPMPAPAARPSPAPSPQEAEPQPRRTPLSVRPSWP